MYMSALPTCIWVLLVCLVASKGSGECQVPWNQSYRWLWASLCIRGTDPVQEQPVLSTTELSLHPPFMSFWKLQSLLEEILTSINFHFAYHLSLYSFVFLSIHFLLTEHAGIFLGTWNKQKSCLVHSFICVSHLAGPEDTFLRSSIL